MLLSRDTEDFRFIVRVKSVFYLFVMGQSGSEKKETSV